MSLEALQHNTLTSEVTKDIAHQIRELEREAGPYHAFSSIFGETAAKDRETSFIVPSPVGPKKVHKILDTVLHYDVNENETTEVTRQEHIARLVLLHEDAHRSAPFHVPGYDLSHGDIPKRVRNFDPHEVVGFMVDPAEGMRQLTVTGMVNKQLGELGVTGYGFFNIPQNPYIPNRDIWEITLHDSRSKRNYKVQYNTNHQGVCVDQTGATGWMLPKDDAIKRYADALGDEQLTFRQQPESNPSLFTAPARIIGHQAILATR